MEIENIINAVQTILYKGFDSTINGGLEWLNVRRKFFNFVFLLNFNKFLLFFRQLVENLLHSSSIYINF